MQLEQYQTFVWSVFLPALQRAHSRSSFQNPSCSLGLSTQDGIYFTHIWQAWWILESKKGFCALVSRCPLTEQPYWCCIISALLETGKADYQNAFKAWRSPRLKQVLFCQGLFPALCRTVPGCWHNNLLQVPWEWANIIPGKPLMSQKQIRMSVEKIGTQVQEP